MSDLEAVDVLAALATVREMLDELALDVPVAGTPTERYMVVEALAELAKTAGIGKGKVSQALFDDLGKGDHPLDDGDVLHVGYTASRTKWDKDALRSELTRKALGVTADGEITATPVEVADRLWSVADIAVGRTKVLRALLDGDLDEYCKEEWKPNMERRPA